MKSDGLLGEDGFPVIQDDPKPPITPIDEQRGFSFDSKEYANRFPRDENDPQVDSTPPLLAQRRPDWDILSIKQINEIADIQLRQEILDYKTFWEQAKQEVAPIYATREQLDNFKTEIQGSLNNLKEGISETIVETLNKLKEDNPGPRIVEPEVAIADVTDPTIDLETENPLEDAVDSVIELEGSIISRKTVGFTPKSLMLYDLTRKKGFRGNFADFVNSCISSALKSRKFKLPVEEDVE